MEIRFTKLWIKEFLVWISELKELYFFVIVVLFGPIWACWYFEDERSILYIGLVLQLVGSLIAIYLLLKVREYFGLPALRTMFADWLKRHPRWRRPIEGKIGVASENGVALSVKPENWSRDDPTLEIAERIDRVVRNLEEIIVGQENLFFEVEKIKRESRIFYREVDHEVEKIKHGVHEERKKFHMGKWGVTFSGLVWILMGLVMTTLPSELSWMIKWLQSI